MKATPASKQMRMRTWCNTVTVWSSASGSS